MPKFFPKGPTVKKNRWKKTAENIILHNVPFPGYLQKTVDPCLEVSLVFSVDRCLEVSLVFTAERCSEVSLIFSVDRFSEVSLVFSVDRCSKVSLIFSVDRCSEVSLIFSVDRCSEVSLILRFHFHLLYLLVSTCWLLHVFQKKNSNPV